jgi:Tfp pilus assembly major pilin PilA
MPGSKRVRHFLLLDFMVVAVVVAVIVKAVKLRQAGEAD